MESVLGLPMDVWDSELEELLRKRELLDDLMESDEDSFLPYFANRTVGNGILAGTLADVALLIWFGDYAMLGDLTMSYAMKAFELASGLRINWNDANLQDDMQKLRDLAD